ncbi:hypothetical protein BU23DRAFT_624922 [Bimuria novae-zelandiae CBS 107.79]|uniref:Uncharacterized protein n=1 Tax=Bimuria novae-zelandiae CBS 107.79 TaxID=1447943 RepID=A0A6A5VRR4_9PLEO|nr:hypothetical protein BU23DRAFT_624922 [Bimuria novae-zelandiae CBS 107.79]
MVFRKLLVTVVAITAASWVADEYDRSKESQRKHAALLEQQAVWDAKLEQRKRQLQTYRDAAEELRSNKFMKKVAWSAARHAILAILLPWLGNLAEQAYFALDALDLADLVSTISDLSDSMIGIQDAYDSLTSVGPLHFGGDNVVNPNDYVQSSSTGDWYKNVSSVTTDMAPGTQVDSWTASQIQEKIEEAKKAYETANKFF